MRTHFALFALQFALCTCCAVAQASAAAPTVGIEQRLGQVVPLDSLAFKDEQGQPISLKQLSDRPVVLTLVYFRCPGICTPLMEEVARVADDTNLKPGVDYRLVTVSFDPADTPELARVKKQNMLDLMRRTRPGPDAWRFLTGDAAAIQRMTDAVGFRYIRDRNEVDFVHAATVVFLSPDGKIVRYLDGLKFGPGDMKMAVADASEGRPRSFMRRLQDICYSYDPAARSYVLNVNRIVLGVTAVIAAAFVVFLLAQGRRRKRALGEQPGGPQP